MSDDNARGLSRRGFLKGTAAVSLGTAATAAGLTPEGLPTAAAAEPAPIPPHGAELRGMDLVTQSPTTEGRFGFMFKNQPAHGASKELLTTLGNKMKEQPVKGDAYIDPKTGQPVMKQDGTGPILVGNNENDAPNENPNPLLTSGFTFVGQFVDHDITFDTTTLSDQQSDPYATTNFRTPRYDLDAIYGRGPNTDPHLYDPNDRDKFKIEKRPYTAIRGVPVSGTVYDVPRDATGKARTVVAGVEKSTIADPRNDQTQILLQLHVAMPLFHNKLVDLMRKQFVPRSAVFESARRLARWHYQWIVIHEFLPAIVGKDMADSVYKEVLTGVPIINIKYYKPTNPLGKPFIPVEFSVAAYRFGHSITRPRYTVQEFYDTRTTPNTLVEVRGVPLFDVAPAGVDVTKDPTKDDNRLNGSRALLPRMKLQWSKFFNEPGKDPTARPVRQFDASLGEPLFTLPSTALPDENPESLLAVRNLLRGKKLGLPSGQQVARLMSVPPLSNAQLSWNHRIYVRIPIATEGPNKNRVEIDGPPAYPNGPGEFDVENKSLKELFVDPGDPGWGGEAPLWFYILKEAEIVGRGRELGPVGGRIVAEVLVGLLQKDLNSYLYLNAAWKPAPPIAPERGKFTMADLLKYVGVYS
jgi:Animal haem peroxidase